MKRCKHENCTIKEEFVCSTEHDIQNGVYFDSINNIDRGTYTGTIDVICYDCGMNIKIYYRNRPKWLKKYLDKINDR